MLRDDRLVNFHGELLRSRPYTINEADPLSVVRNASYAAAALPGVAQRAYVSAIAVDGLRRAALADDGRGNALADYEAAARANLLDLAAAVERIEALSLGEVAQ